VTTMPTVLIVDDNPMLAKGFARALSSDGYDVHLAFSAEEGLRLACHKQPNAIVLDFRMPYVNGVGFLYRLRKLPALRETPVMVLTGAAVDEDTRTEIRYLHAVLRFKPMDMKVLRQEMRALLTPGPEAQTSRSSPDQEGCAFLQSSTRPSGGGRGEPQRGD
jgi:DNA-binding response OmpR family regulator